MLTTANLTRSMLATKILGMLVTVLVILTLHMLGTTLATKILGTMRMPFLISPIRNMKLFLFVLKEIFLSIITTEERSIRWGLCLIFMYLKVE